MPATYARDDNRRQVTITLTDPYTVADSLALVELQAAERAWKLSSAERWLAWYRQG
jgi:hypothetical protein